MKNLKNIKTYESFSTKPIKHVEEEINFDIFKGDSAKAFAMSTQGMSFSNMANMVLVGKYSNMAKYPTIKRDGTMIQIENLTKEDFVALAKLYASSNLDFKEIKKQATGKVADALEIMLSLVFAFAKSGGAHGFGSGGSSSAGSYTIDKSFDADKQIANIKERVKPNTEAPNSEAPNSEKEAQNEAKKSKKVRQAINESKSYELKHVKRK